jgi:hypothetical protein
MEGLWHFAGFGFSWPGPSFEQRAVSNKNMKTGMNSNDAIDSKEK